MSIPARHCLLSLSLLCVTATSVRAEQVQVPLTKLDLPGLLQRLRRAHEKLAARSEGDPRQHLKQIQSARQRSDLTLAELRRRGRAVLGPLQRTLRDGPTELRSTAAWALGKIGPAAAAAVPLLRRLVATTDDEELSQAAANAIGRLRPRVLARLLRHGKEDAVRTRAAIGLGKAGRRALPWLARAAVRDPDSIVRAFAAQSLGEIGDHRAVKVLVRALADERATVRRDAAAALGMLGPKAAAAAAALARVAEGTDRPPLQHGVEQGVRWRSTDQGHRYDRMLIRWEALQALARLGPTAAAPALAALRRLVGDRSTDASLRVAAAGTLARLGQVAESLPVLVAGLKDPGESVRLTAAVDLGALGPRARSARAALERAAKADKAAEVRQAARRALEAIDDRPHE